MDEVERRIRRRLLRPLAKRGKSGYGSYSKALERLDDQAVGESIVARLREQIRHPNQIGPKDRDDPRHVAEQLELAKALFASRRIIKHEYVLFALHSLETLHENRLIAGYYDDELGPITAEISRIEEEHGLGPDEYWPRGEGPKEHIALNRKYDAILDRTFLQLLSEFGLDDLVILKKTNPREFGRLRERGRRSIFHHDEYVLALKDVVSQFERDARKASEVGAYSAAVTSLGGAVEGLLLLRCLRSPHKAVRIAKQLPRRLIPRQIDNPTTWSFEALIEVCFVAGWLPPLDSSIAQYDSSTLAHRLRRLRNYVHPGRRARERPWAETDEHEYDDAEAIYVLLESTLAKVRRNQKSKSKAQTSK